MGHKIFVSYKYADDNVKNLKLFENSTVRDYVDELENKIDNSNHIFKGESDGEDLSNLSEDAIWEKLKDRIYDSTLTIVFISPNMKEDGLEDREQWIPWEISYSLRETKRKNEAGQEITSKTNAMMAVVLPDSNNSYNYYLEDHTCCFSFCRTHYTGKLFKIIRENKLGGYAWDTSAQSVNSGYGINQWGATSNYEGADLMRLLNPGYTNSSINNSLYWEAGAGTCYTSYNNVTKPCDFTSSGLKNSQTKNVISKTKWSLGNGDSVESYVNEMYKVERGTSVITSPTDRVKRTTSWDGYVALAYPSDILYTSDFRTCTTNMNNVFRYEDKCGSSTAWLANLYDSQKDSISIYSTYAYWLLTPGVRSVEFVYRFDGSHFSNSKAASGWLLENEGVDGEVIPTLYLDAGALYKQGNGSSDTPYQILIN